MPLRPCRSGVRVHGGSRLHCARVTVQVAAKLCCTMAAINAAAANLQDCDVCYLCYNVFVRDVCGRMCMCAECFILYMFDCVRVGNSCPVIV